MEHPFRMQKRSQCGSSREPHGNRAVAKLIFRVFLHVKIPRIALKSYFKLIQATHSIVKHWQKSQPRQQKKTFRFSTTSNLELVAQRTQTVNKLEVNYTCASLISPICFSRYFAGKSFSTPLSTNSNNFSPEYSSSSPPRESITTAVPFG